MSSHLSAFQMMPTAAVERASTGDDKVITQLSPLVTENEFRESLTLSLQLRNVHLMHA